MNNGPTKEQAYEAARKVDNLINIMLSDYPIEKCSQQELVAYLLFVRTIRTSLDIIETTVKGELYNTKAKQVIEMIDQAIKEI